MTGTTVSVTSIRYQEDVEAERRYWSRLQEQAGVGTIWQAFECGLKEHHLRTLVSRGSLRRVCYGILAATGAPETYRFRCFMGLLIGGPRRDERGIRAALCRGTAAVHHDMIEPLPKIAPIEVLSTRRLVPRDGIRFHWTSRLPEDELVVKDGLTLTDGLRTFIDMCELQPYRSLRLYRRALRKKIFDEDAALERLKKESRQGRVGIVAARRAVLSTRPDAGRARSATEDRYADLLLDGGYPPPQRNAKVMGSFGFTWEIDLYYPSKRMGFEISPVATHSDPEIVKRDQRKIADLKSLGVDVVPIDDDLSDSDFLRLARLLLGPPEALSLSGTR